MTASRPSILTASSKAPSLAISSTMRKASLEAGVFGCASLILSAFSWDRTVVTTECPCSSKMSIMCAAMKPLPPVFCCCQSYSSDRRMTATTSDRSLPVNRTLVILLYVLPQCPSGIEWLKEEVENRGIVADFNWLGDEMFCWG
jgi:hypothetical protein